jgi:Sortase domain
VTAGHRPGPRGHRPCRPVASGPAGLWLPLRRVPFGPAGPQPPLRPVAVAVSSSWVRAAGMGALLVGSLLLAGCQRPTAPDGDRVDAAPSTHAAGRDTMRVGRPTRIVIPAIGVEARVVAVGLRADGAMEVPDVDLAGWYRPGPRPGERGPAVIVGHVDSRSGPAVFYALNQLRTATASWSGRTAHRPACSRSSGWNGSRRVRCPSDASGTAPARPSCA